MVGKVALCVGVILALVPRESHAGRCGAGCERDDRGDRCWSARDCDDDYRSDRQCCCDGENSCHRVHEPSRPWDSVQTLTFTSKSGLGCDANDQCESDCYQRFSVYVNEVWVMTLTPPDVANCTCPSGNVPHITTEYNAYGDFEYGEGSFTALLSQDRNTATITRQGQTGVCTFTYNVEGNGLNAAAAVAVGIWLVIVCLSFAIPMGGIMCCISTKRKMGAQPQPMAWLACVLIFCFTGPCFMWIPFVIDSCYFSQNNGQPTISYGTNYTPQP